MRTHHWTLPVLALTTGLFACTRDRTEPATPAPSEHAASSRPAIEVEEGVRTVRLAVTERGFEPSPVTVKAGEPLRLVVTRTHEHTCATELVLDEHGINQPLPLNEPVEIRFTPEKAGELRYGCAMGKMISGKILVE